MRFLISANRASIVAAVMLVVVACHSAHAAIRIYTIDTSASVITISGTVNIGESVFDVSEQAPGGSLTTHYSGSIRTDVAPGTIQFVSGSGNIIDANTSGNWAPLPNGGNGTALADYGGFVDVPDLISSAVLAGRNFVGNLTSNVFSVTNHQFNPAGATLTFTSGNVDYRTQGLFTDANTESIVGEISVLTSNSGFGSVVQAGVIQTLTIPIDSVLVVNIPSTAFPGLEIVANLNLVGQVIATATVSAIPGDFNGDGDVDGGDFAAWQSNFPKSASGTLAQGDADGDGDIDGADFIVWQTHFPTAPVPGVAPVPEPGSAMLLLLGIVPWLARKASRRS